ncbi:unnamed protein product [Ranitomeya imitator]|uniref:Lectin n=1 Tax=Ranitomeya imitator TaxID=111125 RepID=A0ABN9LKH6_9NEOB|nr:unnamed protein product [Ranitomeya imitator]
MTGGRADFTLHPSIFVIAFLSLPSAGPYGHTVKQYSPSGALLKTLGTPGIAGSRLSPLQFDQPADIFIKGEDEVYIVDGDGGMNNRLLKLTDDFSLQWTLGGNGTKPGQFYIPHSVVVDDVGRRRTKKTQQVAFFLRLIFVKKRRTRRKTQRFCVRFSIWVADRGNKRIQVFDTVGGEWIGSWDSCFSEDGPYSVRYIHKLYTQFIAQRPILASI